MAAEIMDVADKSFDYLIIGGGVCLPNLEYTSRLTDDVDRRVDSCSPTLRGSFCLCCSP
jgi:hypothetical protein